MILPISMSAQYRSQLTREHPDWLLQHNGKPWYAGCNWGGFFSLDIDNPGVQDYLKRKGFVEWFGKNPRFERLHEFCKYHYRYEDYQPLLAKMDDEELANMAICLCHQVDKAMTKYIERKDKEFTTEGGIRERMTAARLGQRETQRQTIERQANEIAALRKEVERLKALLAAKD